MVLRNADGLIADSLNYSQRYTTTGDNPGVVHAEYVEGYMGISGSNAHGCMVQTPFNGLSAARYPNGVDTDSNCIDFVPTPTPTPKAPNSLSRTPGNMVVSLQLAGTNLLIQGVDKGYSGTAGTSEVVLKPVTTTSTDAEKRAATFMVMDALSGNAGCVSFQSVDQPGQYLRAAGYRMVLNPDDGTSGIRSAASFCPVETVGTATPTVDLADVTENLLFRNTQYNTRYLRGLDGNVYLNTDGVTGTSPQIGDAEPGWAAQVRWNIVTEGVSNATWVRIDPPSHSLLAGEEMQFRAKVEGPNGPTQLVTWTVTGALSEGTTISSTGVLTVGADETATSLTVKATSTASQNITGSSIIAIQQIEKTQPTLSLEASPTGGQTAPGNVTLTATLENSTFVEGQLISFIQNSLVLGTAALDENGVATYVITSPAAGTYTFGASYAGDPFHAAATAADVVGYIVRARGGPTDPPTTPGPSDPKPPGPIEVHTGGSVVGAAGWLSAAAAAMVLGGALFLMRRRVMR